MVEARDTGGDVRFVRLHIGDYEESCVTLSRAIYNVQREVIGVVGIDLDLAQTGAVQTGKTKQESSEAWAAG